MSVKRRVFQVAREFNVSNEALIDFLKSHGYDVRNHMSPVADDEYAKITDKFGEKPVQPDSENEFRKRLKEKQAKGKEDVVKTRQELEERIRVATELAVQKPKLVSRPHEETMPAPTGKEKERVAPPGKEEKPAVPKIEGEVAPADEKKTLERRHHKMKVVEIPPKEQERPKREVIEPKPHTEGVTAPGEAGAETPSATPTKAQVPEKKAKKKRKKDRKKHAPTETLEETFEEAAKGKKDKKKKKKKVKPQFNEEEIQQSIRQTLASMEDTGRTKRKKRRFETDEMESIEEIPVIRVSEFMSLSELAKLMDVEASELIRKCIEMGMMVTINQRLDMDAITLLASEYEYEVEALSDFAVDLMDELDKEDESSELYPRPPVVTIMGHVDHGKTSLLDQIRESNIIAGESGGITQHIGAYEVFINGKAITFLDTPGHEAFTAMRARGAKVTDIVVLVVAADDNVMPQTIEAISHAKAAEVPIIVAINKIDKPSANPDFIRKQLAEYGVLVEQWGGKNQSVEISAKTGLNIEQLLDLILLEAEILDLKASPGRKAKGVVIEAKLDKGKGVMATVLVQNGTLKIGDPFIAGSHSGKVRSMMDERSHRIREAGPSAPVQVLGFDGLPQAGDSFMVLQSERDTKEISQKRQQLQREHEHWRSRPRTLDEISRQIKKGQIKQLSVVLKTDVDGSLEAITDSLQKLATSEVAVDVIHRGVGAITESDVLLASASSAIIIGFNVRPSVKARQLADREDVDIRSYNVIYDIVDDVKSALEGFLSPTISERNVGTLEIRQIFKVPKVGVIAGSYVLSGKINR
ncbi:MAG: translation initiation factor IF-2, partial [Calditrichaeota bacterium]